MPPERRRLVVLILLLCVTVVGAVVYELWPETAVPGPARSNTRVNSRNGGPTTVTAPDVHLQALSEDKPEPEAPASRDLFRFKPKAPPPRAATPAPPTVNTPPPPPAPTGPPPISLRFIGLLEAPEHAQKIAVLSDGRGIYQGREGDIIEGRYRILRIGVESIEMAYLDGRGRQTIRLSGS
jgi:hypothetical protein